MVVPALERLESLGGSEDPDLPIYCAHGHVILGDALAGGATGLSLATPRISLQRRRLQRRQELMRAAEEHYRAAADERAPLWTCAGGVQLAGMYEAFAQALREAPPPAGLDAGQQAIYRSKLAEIADGWQIRAREVYRDTIGFAERSGVRNAWADRARERMAAMDLPPP
jgi:hypothetical protein